MTEWTKLKISGIETEKRIPIEVMNKIRLMEDYQKEFFVWQMIEDKVKHTGLKGTLNYIDANIILAREEKGRE